ncbi:MAG: TIGR00730 family Rossman fold protein [Planctomycetota bacterium]|nr:TIGR00730 family Rossman fold protein [Planctomycetota bacterium]
MIRSVTVYCSSSRHVDGVYLAAADALGRGIARCGWSLVYGGNYIGCMAALADGARAANGKVVGITPQFLADKGLADHQCAELLITPDISQRKVLMAFRGDAFIALPGGIGTLEEVFEILVGRYLGCHTKPIVLLSIERFYEPLLSLLRHGLDLKFNRDGLLDLLHVTDNVESALTYLQQQSNLPQSPPPAQTRLPRIE